MKIGVVTFPGSLDDHDASRAVRVAGGEPVSLWHGDDSLREVDAVVLPGGFSYGDYLRAGAIARFAPVLSALIPAARGGLPVLGLCHGFQILWPSHLPPGAVSQDHHRNCLRRPPPLHGQPHVPARPPHPDGSPARGPRPPARSVSARP